MPNTALFVGPDTATPIVFPTDTTSVAIAAPTAQWAFNATWTQIVASTGAGFVLCGVVVRLIRTVATYGTIELGTGAAASEVHLDAFSYSGFVSGVVDDIVSFIILHSQLIGPHYIPAGTRIAGRNAQHVATGWSTAAIYLYGFTVSSPEIATRFINQRNLIQGFATKGGDRLPTTDFIALTHSGAAYTQGAWVEIAASTTEDLVVEGISLLNVTSARDYVVSLGYGTAGNEVMLPAFFPMMSSATTTPSISNIPAPLPLFVPKGSRLVARQKANSTSGTTSVAVKVTYLK